jgi:hypothetical protein
VKKRDTRVTRKRRYGLNLSAPTTVEGVINLKSDLLAFDLKKST